MFLFLNSVSVFVVSLHTWFAHFLLVRKTGEIIRIKRFSRVFHLCMEGYSSFDFFFDFDLITAFSSPLFFYPFLPLYFSILFFPFIFYPFLILYFSILSFPFIFLSFSSPLFFVTIFLHKLFFLFRTFRKFSNLINIL